MEKHIILLHIDMAINEYYNKRCEWPTLIVVSDYLYAIAMTEDATTNKGVDSLGIECKPRYKGIEIRNSYALDKHHGIVMKLEDFELDMSVQIGYTTKDLSNGDYEVRADMRVKTKPFFLDINCI